VKSDDDVRMPITDRLRPFVIVGGSVILRVVIFMLVLPKEYPIRYV